LAKDAYVTINDMNTVQEITKGQINANPKTGEEVNTEETTTKRNSR